MINRQFNEDVNIFNHNIQVRIVSVQIAQNVNVPIFEKKTNVKPIHTSNRFTFVKKGTID